MMMISSSSLVSCFHEDEDDEDNKDDNNEDENNDDEDEHNEENDDDDDDDDDVDVDVCAFKCAFQWIISPSRDENKKAVWRNSTRHIEPTFCGEKNRWGKFGEQIFTQHLTKPWTPPAPLPSSSSPIRPVGPNLSDVDIFGTDPGLTEVSVANFQRQKLRWNSR